MRKINEQDARSIINSFKYMLMNVLEQKDINVSDIDIIPTHFPERGIKIMVKGVHKSDRDEARQLIKELISGLDIMGPKKSISINEQFDEPFDELKREMVSKYGHPQLDSDDITVWSEDGELIGFYQKGHSVMMDHEGNYFVDKFNVEPKVVARKFKEWLESYPEFS